ncbi:hypothetical protein C5Y97_03470 [Blastopirellula marina]|uniref:Uncharacterized protein n=1 Tax=Blastopirellula marina TaxID=124 RepID=A0A2S8G998_9BACT|nr:hypothetical protein C5Y98_03470 [Blastopirellula marina]PTL45911.1 hypothetical protein C5Y97_03470 [Blastopirellula marina]
MEVVFTSAERGLEPGQSGFCVVARSPSVPRIIQQRLEAASGYRHHYLPHEHLAHLNPVNFGHYILELGPERQHILCRIGDAGLDYSQRTNRLAHLVALPTKECPVGGPAWLLSQPGFTLPRWSGPPNVLPLKAIPSGDCPVTPCRNWQKACGDAGWAGLLAETVVTLDRAPTYIIFPPGLDTLPLMEEAIALLPFDYRWEATFTTYFSSVPIGMQCRWRCVLAGTPEAAAARNSPGSLVLDLTSTMGPAPNTSFADAAREGRMLEASARPVHAATEVESEASPGMDRSFSSSSMAASTSGRPNQGPPRSKSPPRNRQGEKFSAKAILLGLIALFMTIGVAGIGTVGVVMYRSYAEEDRRQRQQIAQDTLDNAVQLEQKFVSWNKHVAKLQQAWGERETQAKDLQATADQLASQFMSIGSDISKQTQSSETLRKTLIELYEKLRMQVEQLRQPDMTNNQKAEQLKQAQATFAEIKKLIANRESGMPDTRKSTSDQAIRFLRNLEQLDTEVGKLAQAETLQNEKQSLIQRADELQKADNTQLIEPFSTKQKLAWNQAWATIEAAKQGSELEQLEQTQTACLTTLEQLRDVRKKSSSELTQLKSLEEAEVGVQNEIEKINSKRESIRKFLEGIDLVVNSGEPQPNNPPPEEKNDFIQVTQNLPPQNPSEQTEVTLAKGISEKAPIKLELKTAVSELFEPTQMGIRQTDEKHWKIVVGSNTLATLQLVDGNLVFQWSEAAAGMRDSAQQIHDSVLLVESGEPSSRVAIRLRRIVPEQNELRIFKLNSDHSVAVKTSQLGSEPLRLKLLSVERGSNSVLGQTKVEPGENNGSARVYWNIMTPDRKQIQAGTRVKLNDLSGASVELLAEAPIYSSNQTLSQFVSEKVDQLEREMEEARRSEQNRERVPALRKRRDRWKDFQTNLENAFGEAKLRCQIFSQFPPDDVEVLSFTTPTAGETSR